MAGNFWSPNPVMGAKAAAILPLSEEKRRFQRVRVNILGRYMLPNKREYPCQVVDMSPGGARLVAPEVGEVHDRVIAYLDHIGRVEGQIARVFDGGFAISINATTHKRDKLASQLTWLANRDLGLPEDRRHARLVPRNPYSEISLADGRRYRCKVLDMSLSGAAIACEICPAPGTPVRMGNTEGVVVRQIEGGFAIEFSTVQSMETLTRQFGQIQ
ncbi:PilZ domain-containing protein [Microbaculum sp. FT89]|uniref:PilZ domain-containing protein n=1 Tax=Microbaculum sp. FT89 TaxID=3447298 RepID=UPI003F531FDA